jgi:hypothetical protein
MATPITGDMASTVPVKQQQGVTLHNMPQVGYRDISDASHPINQSNLSGKRLGALVIAVDEGNISTGRMSLMIAHGSGPTDGWSPLVSRFISEPQYQPVYSDIDSVSA